MNCMENKKKPEDQTSEVETQIAPPKNTKEWLKNCLVGFFVGLAVIVPGISGATITIIFKIYDKLLNAVSNLFKKFKNCFLYLLPVVIGAIIGFIGGFFGVQAALNYIPFAIICLFAGLMIGAFPAVNDEIKGEKKTPLRISLLIIGFLIPIVLSVCVTLLTGNGNDGTAFATIEWWEYIVFLVIGFVVSITQVVPGLSASAFLMMIGYFNALMGSFHLEYWKQNPKIFGIYAALIVGSLVGLFLTSKFLNKLFEKSRKTTFFAIVGLSAGAIVSIFFNSDVYEVYQIWAGVVDKSTNYPNAVSMPIDLSLGIGLLIVGFAISFALYMYQKKHDEQQMKLENK